MPTRVEIPLPVHIYAAYGILKSGVKSEQAPAKLREFIQDISDAKSQTAVAAATKMLGSKRFSVDLPSKVTIHSLRPDQLQSANVSWINIGFTARSKLTSLFAPKSAGKTQFTNYLTADCAVRHLKVVRLNTEDDFADILKPDLIAAISERLKVEQHETGEGKPANLQERAIELLNKYVVFQDHVVVESGGRSAEMLLQLDNPDHLDAMTEWLKEESADLVIIEPVTNYKSGKSKLNDEDAMRPIYTSVVNMARAIGCGVLIAGHTNRRTDAASVLEKALGASATTGVARLVFTIGKRNEERAVVNAGSNRKCAKGFYFSIEGCSVTDGKTTVKDVAYLVRGRDVDFDADELLEEQQDHHKQETKSARAWLLDQLKGELPHKTDDLRKAAKRDGVPWDAVRTAKSRLKAKVETLEECGRSAWQLAPEELFLEGEM